MDTRTQIRHVIEHTEHISCICVDEEGDRYGISVFSNTGTREFIPADSLEERNEIWHRIQSTHPKGLLEATKLLFLPDQIECLELEDVDDFGGSIVVTLVCDPQNEIAFHYTDLDDLEEDYRELLGQLDLYQDSRSPFPIPQHMQ